MWVNKYFYANLKFGRNFTPLTARKEEMELHMYAIDPDHFLAVLCGAVSYMYCYSFQRRMKDGGGVYQ